MSVGYNNTLVTYIKLKKKKKKKKKKVCKMATFYVRLDVITFIWCVFVAAHCLKTELGDDLNIDQYGKTSGTIKSIN